MSRAKFNPIIFRSIFNHFQLTTPRMYETFAANTIPILAMDEETARLHFGDSVKDLVINNDKPEIKIMDIINRPDDYTKVVADVRVYLDKHHSHASRLNELIDLVEI